jgi:SH3-like domain-containing protein
MFKWGAGFDRVFNVGYQRMPRAFAAFMLAVILGAALLAGAPSARAATGADAADNKPAALASPAVDSKHADANKQTDAKRAAGGHKAPGAAAASSAPNALPVPRFVTLGADEVNVRTGPALKYPIKFVIRKDGLPVEILREWDVWRDIRDKDGDGGWVLKSMLSGKRAVIVTGKTQRLLKKPDPAARPVVKLEPGVIAGLATCKGDWCSLKIQGYAGWIKRESVWGVYPDERFQ